MFLFLPVVRGGGSLGWRHVSSWATADASGPVVDRTWRTCVVVEEVTDIFCARDNWCACACVVRVDAGAMVTVRSEQTPLRSTDTAAALRRRRRPRRGTGCTRGTGYTDAVDQSGRAHSSPSPPLRANLRADLSIDLRRLRDRRAARRARTRVPHHPLRPPARPYDHPQRCGGEG